MSGKKLKQMFVTYTFVLPDFIGLLVFIIIPIIYSFYMSLYDWNFANIKQFIGIQNYVTMFSDSEWWQSLGRTFKLTLLYVPALFILSILFAVLVLVVDFVVYYPFFKVYDKQKCEEEDEKGGYVKEEDEDVEVSSDVVNEKRVLVLCAGGGTSGLLANALAIESVRTRKFGIEGI